MTEILDMNVDWMIGYYNRPSINLLLDNIPSKEEQESIPYQVLRKNGWLYLWKNMSGLVTFIVRSADLTKETDGFGGMHFNILTTEGRMEFDGAWSSRYSVMNQLFTPHVLNVAVSDNEKRFKDGKVFLAYKYNYVITDLSEALKQFLPDLELVFLDIINNETIILRPISEIISKEEWYREYEIFPCLLDRAFCSICKSIDKEYYQKKILNNCPRCKSKFKELPSNQYI